MPANSDNADNGKDGFMDRLAKTMFASPNSPFTSFADKQRIERLDQCQQLQLIVDACHAANSKDNVDDTSDIQTSRSGIRISRFYKWGGSGDEQQDGASTANSASDVFSEAASSFTEGGNNNNTQTQSTQQQKSNTSRARYSKGCAIETHELWACKALAVGCGNYLSDLRHCWSNNQQEQTSVKKNEDGMTYHNGNTDQSCRSIQVDMARCVNTNKAELEERRKAVEKQ